MWSSQEFEARFFGAFEHSLDVKGRITLPAKFRVHFIDRCFVAQSQFGDPCLAVWLPEDFFGFASNINNDQWADDATRRSLRSWAREAFECEIDKLGRFAIPANLRRYASLNKEVSVHGAVGTVELWDPVIWSRYQAEKG